MNTSKRKKVPIVFLNKPNFDELGFKFLVLNLNKLQQCFEFEFPEIDEYSAGEERDYDDASVPLLEFQNYTRTESLEGDYFIGIVTGIIGENLFWVEMVNHAIITTKQWQKHFSPPSVLEYLIHSIIGILIVMSDEKRTLSSHRPTRGCCLDYTFLKEDDKADIALGYICDNCASEIREKLGEDYLKCFEKMNSMEWLGEVEEMGTVAYDLKKYFKIDLNKDTGFHKTLWDKAKEHLTDVTKAIIIAACSALISVIITLWLVGSQSPA